MYCVGKLRADVAAYAQGPWSHLMVGTVEQTHIHDVMLCEWPGLSCCLSHCLSVRGAHSTRMNTKTHCVPDAVDKSACVTYSGAGTHGWLSLGRASGPKTRREARDRRPHSAWVLQTSLVEERSSGSIFSRVTYGGFSPEGPARSFVAAARWAIVAPHTTSVPTSTLISF